MFPALFQTEPSFEGRYLSDWIWVMNAKEAGPEKEQARAVVRRLGCQSVPLLLKWLREENRQSLTGKFDQVRHGVFFWLVNHHLIPNRSIASLRDFNPSHSAMATWALPELDHLGRTTAIPTLIQMLREKNQRQGEISRGTGGALLVLSKMAPESIAPLIETLSGPDFQGWALAASALGEIGPDAKAAIPILQQNLQAKDPVIRVGAAGIIGKLGGDPNLFIPVVIRSLPEIDRSSLDYALEVLIRYREYTKAAIPILTGILNATPDSTNSTNRMVRDQVINTIRQIDPDALPQPQ